jgi:hypothetical protein
MLKVTTTYESNMYIIAPARALIHYTIDFKQFLTCFDVCDIIFRGVKLEH